MSTITTRAGKGSPLTNNEVDANFTNLNNDKLESADLSGYAELTGATFTGDVEGTEFIGSLRGNNIFKAQAGEALSKGDAVYISGISGNTPVVSLADADSAGKMPAFGLASDAASANSAVDIVTYGQLTSVDTSAFSLGDTLYVSNTPGQLTSTAPSGESSLIQNLGKVERVHATAGILFVAGAGRTNATPNLNDGQFFLGNGSNQAVSADFTTSVLGEISAGTGIGISASGVISNTDPDQTVSLTGGTGISTSGTYPNFTITNDSPDQTVSLTGAGAASISGTYPNFTISSTDSNTTYTAGTGITLSGTTFSLTDTNAKLNLTGGTLTGALSGTTAQFANVGVGASPNVHGLYVYHTDNYEAAKFQTNLGGSLARFTDATASIEMGVQGGKPVIRTSNAARLTVDGANVDINSGALKMAGTTVIDASRNLTNIAQINASGKIYGGGSSVSTGYTGIFGERQVGASDSNKLLYFFVQGSTAKIDAYDYGTGSGLDFELGGNGGDVSIASSADLKMGTTTVIDSSRNVFATRLKATTAVHAGSTGYWKLRDNSGGSQLVAEYSTSDGLSDSHIKWRVDSSGNMKARGAVIGGNAYSPTGSLIGNVASYGGTNAYVSASDENGQTAFFGVDTSGYAMFGALTNHNTVIRANNSEKLRIQTNGVINIAASGMLAMNGVTVIDASRTITTPKINIGDGNDGYFYNDTSGRVAFAGGDFYIQNSVSNYYNYATNQYFGDSSGDTMRFRSNVLNGTGWEINGAGKLTTRDHLINAGYHLQRSDHHTGHLEGSYNNVGGNGAKSNPIYTIGNAYNPADSTLGNMYGIGFTSAGASFINGAMNTGDWGMYVAADGDARVWLEGSQGRVVVASDMRSPLYYDSNNTGYYLHPDSTSNLNAVSLVGALTLQNKINFPSGSSSGTTFGANHYSMGVDIANGGWSGSNYSDLIIGYHTGIRIGGGYSGVRFYNNSPTTDANNDGNGDSGEALLMTIGGGGSSTSGAHVTVNNDLIAGAIRSDNFQENAGTFLFRKGSGSGRHRHLNLANTTGDPSDVTDAQNPTGISWGQRSDNNGYYMLGLKGAYNNGNSTHSRLAMGWHTGLEIGANPTYGGTRFFSDSPYVTSTEIMSIGKSDSNVRVSNSLYANDVRASIYYDSNDTGYYIDPNSRSRFDQINAGGGIASSSTNYKIKVSSASNGNSQMAQSTTAMILGPASTRSATANHYYAGIGFNGLLNYNGSTGYDNACHVWVGAKFKDFPGSERSTFCVGVKSGTGTTGTGADLPQERFSVDYGGTALASGSFRAPIFYDSNDTNYYIDPASTSNINGITVQGTIYGSRSTNTNYLMPNMMSAGASNSAGVVNYHIRFNRNDGTANGHISTNYYATTYSTTSDYRVKEDVQPMGDATSRLMALNPVNFQWKDSDIRTDGFIAHEVAEVVSDAVVGEKDAVDEKGNDELQSLDQSKLVPLLVKTIQEQQSVIEALEARISALEA